MAFEASTSTNYSTLYDRVRAALKDVLFMGVELGLTDLTGTFAWGETVNFTGGTGVARAFGDNGDGNGALIVDGLSVLPATGGTLTGASSLAVATIGTRTSRAWVEQLYEALTPDYANGYAQKRSLLKNGGDGGTDEIWLTLEQVTAAAGVAGIRVNGGRSWDALVGWAGISLVASYDPLLPMANTGNADRDAVKYWLVADRKRVLLAVHTEYLIGGGQCMWAHSGYLHRWDPPSQYPQPHLVGSPVSQVYTTVSQNLGFFTDYASGVRTIIHPVYPLTTLTALAVEQDPKIANPDGTHTLLPMWIWARDSNQNPIYLGEVEGLFYTDSSVALGETFSLASITYVALQNYVPGRYAVLRLE